MLIQVRPPRLFLQPLVLVSTVILCSTAFAPAQGVPHISVNPSTYRTLVAPGSTIAAAMCETSDAFCFAHDVGKPVVAGREIYVSARGGDIYIATSDLIYRLSPRGQITVIAGQYGKSPAGDLPLTSPPHSAIGSINTMAVDGGGNIYLGVFDYFGKNGALLKLDTLGVIHRLTATPGEATPSPIEDALASTQNVNPTSLATDVEGNIYVSDSKTGTVRRLSAKTGRLDTIVGCLTPGCSLAGLPASGASASKYNIAGSIGLDDEDLLYFTYSGLLYSVTPDGILHKLASATSITGLGSYPISGPVSGPGAGNIGYPAGQLIVDAAGDVYFVAEGEDFSSLEGNTVLKLVEVTKGTAKAPAQILVLANGPEGSPAYLGFPVINPEGMPSTLTLGLTGSFALDAEGRIVTSSTPTPYQVQDYYQYAGFPGAYAGPLATGISILDRNGSAVFDNGFGEMTPQPTSPQIVTLTNSGTAPLKTIDIAGTGLPYYLFPYPGDLAYKGVQGAAPFTIDTRTGTCVPKYEPTRTLTLQPGESCTLAFDYTPNPGIEQAGLFVLYTNDPRGPLAIHLTATRYSTEYATGVVDETSFGRYYNVNLSATTITPASLASTNGDFTVAASVASAQGFLGYFSNNADLGISYFAIADLPFVPTGRIYAAVSNNKTGAFTGSSVNTLDADGNTTFKFTGLAPGTYLLGALYLGDGTNAPSYSSTQTLTVEAKK